MKSLILFSVLVFVSAVQANDLRDKLDPWGFRKKADEAQQQKSAVEGQIAQRRSQLPSAQSQHKEVSEKLSKKKAVIEKLRAQVNAVLSQEDARLTQLIQRQTEQANYSQAILASAQEVEKSVRSMAEQIFALKTHAQVAQILSPLFVNSESNRVLWITALKQIESQTGLSSEDRKSAAQLRDRIEKANDWFWRRPGELMSGYMSLLAKFHENVNQALAGELLGAAQKLTANLAAQVQVQQGLLETMIRLKQSHEAMVGALH
ncbi:MAG: hypothetical protein AB7F86_01200 [Bdellovibrionales bacterium]